MVIMEFDTNTLGSVLRDRRLDLGMTQQDLSQLIKVAPSTISNYELGIVHPTLGTLMKILRALKIDELRIDTGRRP